MSSYHSSFTYNEKNSAKDYGLIIAAFEPDNGFTDSFLSMENVSDPYFDGTKKFNYGSKYNSSAEIQITLIKKDGTDMTVNEFRSLAKRFTGARVDSWLDMYVGDSEKRPPVYSFLGKFTNLEHYKLDGRIIGCRLTFSSVSPWAYSAPQHFDCYVRQDLCVVEDGVLKRDSQSLLVNNGILHASTDGEIIFKMESDGTLYLENLYQQQIDNESDDLYTYIYLDIDYINEKSSYFSIKNITLGEESIVTDISANETISLSAKQFITSSIPNKIFGHTFNFVWPRLKPGDNNFMIKSDGRGLARFTYRYPMKIGDCAMDVSVYGGGIGCCECGEIPPYNTVRWEDIIGSPTTLGGYGITDAYTANEVDAKFDNIEWSDINNTPATIEGYGITDVYTKNEINSALSNVKVKWENVENTPTTVGGYEISDAYTKSDVYTKTEIDDKIDNIEISGGGGGNTTIDEEELNSMLNDILS